MFEPGNGMSSLQILSRRIGFAKNSPVFFSFSSFILPRGEDVLGIYSTNYGFIHTQTFRTLMTTKGFTFIERDSADGNRVGMHLNRLIMIISYKTPAHPKS